MTNEKRLANRALAEARTNPLSRVQEHLPIQAILAEIGTINWPLLCKSAPYVWDLRNSRTAMDEARRDLVAIPDLELADRLSAAVSTALAEPPDLGATRASIAVLFDTLPRQPANPATYLNALCFDLMDLGFQPAVVAAACQELRRTAVFVPVIAEVIEACRKVQSHYGGLQRLPAYAREARTRLADAIADAEREGPSAPAYRPSPDWKPEA